ncbi:MAG: DUF362 domain-containing protein [Candidatus Aminicenantes bacterium]
MWNGERNMLNRREFLKGSVIGLACLPTIHFFSNPAPGKENTAKIALVKAKDRTTGVREVLKLFDYPSAEGKEVLIKPNFNTADPTPGSTHNHVLGQLVKEIHAQGAKKIAVGDRSGPIPTAEVLEDKKIHQLGQELDFQVLNFSELPEKDWIPQNPEGNHWAEGFLVARPVLQTEYIVSTCCLKTHQYGGVFTMSLKLSVGITPRKLMGELHSSPHMRKMIAEINTAYSPQLIVLDGMEAFVDKGPMTGPKKSAHVFLAGSDRIAIDAAGLAVLKELGSNKAIMETKIFEQEQIKRASELKLGIEHPDQIEFITPDRDSRIYAQKLKSILAQG